MRTHQERLYRPYLEILGVRELPGNLFSMQFHGFADESNQLSLVRDEMHVVSVRSLQSTPTELNYWIHHHLPDDRSSMHRNPTNSTSLTFSESYRSDSSVNWGQLTEQSTAVHLASAQCVDWISLIRLTLTIPPFHRLQ